MCGFVCGGKAGAKHASTTGSAWESAGRLESTLSETLLTWSATSLLEKLSLPSALAENTTWNTPGWEGVYPSALIGLGYALGAAWGSWSLTETVTSAVIVAGCVVWCGRVEWKWEWTRGGVSGGDMGGGVVAQGRGGGGRGEDGEAPAVYMTGQASYSAVLCLVYLIWCGWLSSE